MSNLTYCMFCHTTNPFGTTTIIYQGQQLKYCQNCEHKIIHQTLIKQNQNNKAIILITKHLEKINNLTQTMIANNNLRKE